MGIRGAIRELVGRPGSEVVTWQPPAVEAMASRLDAIEAAQQAAQPNLPERYGYETGIPRGGLNEINQGIGASAGSDRRSSLTELYDMYTTCTWSWAAVNAIARTITAGGLVTDWDSDDGEGDQEPPEKPANVLAMERLFAYCNPREDIRQLMRGVIADLEVFGDAYLEVTWLNGIPVALYSLDSTSMFPNADEHGTISKYVQLTDLGQRAVFEPHEVIHISLDSPRSGIFGVSPTQANSLPIMAWLFGAATLKETYRKGNPPNLHVDFPAATTDQQMGRWDQQYSVRNIGPRNIGRPVITKGGATVNELATGNVADTMAFLDQKRDEILAGYGVPPAEATVIESGNLGGGTGEAQHKMFTINTCQPIAELVLEKLQFAIAKLGFGVVGWRLKFKDVDLRDSLVIEQIRDSRVRNAGYTINKGRAEIGEPAVEGGDQAVIIDRQNIILVRDLEASSSAGIASKLKGTSLEVDEPTPGAPVQLHKPEPVPVPAALAPFAGAVPPAEPAPPVKKKGKHRAPEPDADVPPAAPAKPTETVGAARHRLSEAWQETYSERLRTALAELPPVAIAVEHKGNDGDSHHQHNHHDGPDYEPSDLGLSEPLKTERVDPRDVHVDHSYQRKQIASHVKTLSELPIHDLSRRVGLLARRPDGSLWVVDGQHHTAAAVKANITSLHYKVFDSTGAKMEAKVYAAWQKWDRADHPEVKAKSQAEISKV